MSFLKFLRSNKFISSNKSIVVCYSVRRQYNDVAFGDIPEVSPALIKRVLKSNNVGYEEGYACYIIECLMCKSTKNVTHRAYINKTTGLYICPHCKKSGDWNYVESRFGNNKKPRKAKIDADVEIDEAAKLKDCLEDIKSRTKEVKSLSNTDFVQLFEKFKLPIISTNSIEKFDIRIHDTNNTLYFPLENAESELVGFRTLSTTHKESILPSIDYGGVLASKNLKSNTAILVPNISDFLALLNSKVGGNVVCLPNGVNNLSQYVLPSLERYKKLILWLGNDLKSWDAAKQFSKKLGEKRCQFVRPNEKNQLPHLVKEEDFKSILSSAQAVFHKSITTFSGLRAEVLSDLQNIDKVQGVKWKRYPTLNKILKGHRRGELTVITGPTGSGKTTFISEYSLDLAMQGVNTLWGSFEIRNARLARTMLQQMSGIPLDENLHLFEHWADEFEKLPVYYMTFHGQQSIKVVMEAVEHATYVHDIAHVIIDNVQFMMGIGEEQRHMDRFWKQDAIIDAFRTFATRKNCHVTLVIHPRKEKDDEDLTTSSIFGGAKASQEADNVLIIQDKRLTSVRGKKYLQVAKNRYTGDLGIMTLDFDKSSLSYSSKKPRKGSDEKPKESSDTGPELFI